jgi:hypothetical protein
MGMVRAVALLHFLALVILGTDGEGSCGMINQCGLLDDASVPLHLRGDRSAACVGGAPGNRRNPTRPPFCGCSAAGEHIGER